MKSTSQAGTVLVLVMIVIVLASLFWFLYSDYDEVREQAETANSRATRVAAMEQEAGQLRAATNQFQATRTALETELSTLEQEAVNDQLKIQELETRVAAETAVTSIPEVIIASPINGAVVQLSTPVTLTVAAFDPNGLQAINIVFDNNPPLEIPIGGDSGVIIEEPWPLSEAGAHTAVITAVNTANISSEAAPITITAENKRTGQQIKDEVANIMGVLPAQTPPPNTTPTAQQTSNIAGKSERNTTIILQMFDFPTPPSSDDALDWGVYCLLAPQQPTVPDAVESPADEIAFVRGQIREWQETQFQVSQRLRATPSDDTRAAICATAVGHERWVLEEYIRQAPTDRQAALFAQLPPLTEPADREPLSMQQSFGESYGPAFINTLVTTNGPTVLLDVWQTPPQSSYQILYPHEYRESFQPEPIARPDLTSTLGDDWVPTTTNVLGAFMLRRYLENHIEPTLAGTAVSGWYGDQYTIYRNEENGQTFLIFQLNWALEKDAQEFATTYEQYITSQDGGKPVKITSPAPSICWQHTSGDTTCLISSKTRTIIIKAPEANLAIDSLAAVIEN
ncbi:MAG: hypothetical protein CSA11_05095 [Chloroflexi bacterium]|nr:MAG: hypothetical protein CSA11_05095 [Chloroflexota bacterium]